MPTSIDFPSVRAGIVNVLKTIPELKRVNSYIYDTEARNNLPYADLMRGPVTGPTVSIYGEDRGDEGLGQYVHLITWTITVHARLASKLAAQQADDLYAARLLDAFNTDRLLDPNGPGVVDNSRLIEIIPFEHDQGPWWVTIATLQTKIKSTL